MRILTIAEYDLVINNKGNVTEIARLLKIAHHKADIINRSIQYWNSYEDCQLYEFDMR